MINGTAQSYSKIPFFKDSNASIVDSVRDGMKTYPKDTRKAATHARMGHNTFAKIRALINKLDREDISQDRKNDIREALRIIDQKRYIPRIIRGLFNEGKPSKKDLSQDKIISEKHQKRFVRTMIAISEICETTVEMEIPDLSEKEVRGALRTLRRSKLLIRQLMLRLNKEEQNDD